MARFGMNIKKIISNTCNRKVRVSRWLFETNTALWANCVCPLFLVHEPLLVVLSVNAGLRMPSGKMSVCEMRPTPMRVGFFSTFAFILYKLKALDHILFIHIKKSRISQISPSFGGNGTLLFLLLSVIKEKNATKMILRQISLEAFTIVWYI